MADLCWMVLTFLLTVQNSMADVDPSWLTQIVEGIKNEYSLGDSFSLAANIPQNQDPSNLEEVLQDDSADRVKEAVSQGQVYQGTRVVAAAQSEAMLHVLQHIQPFIKSSHGNVLVIYSEEVPNAKENGINGIIGEITQKLHGYAFVFSKVAQHPGADPSQLAISFRQLGISKLGLNNIFRCYTPEDASFQCTSCSSGRDVATSCVANTAQSNTEAGAADVEPLGQEGGAADVEPFGHGTGTDISDILSYTGGVRGREEKGKGGKISKCKGVQEGGCKGKAGRRGKKGGKVRRGRKQRRGGKVRRGRKQRRGGKVRRGRKQRRGGKSKRRPKTRGKGKRRKKNRRTTKRKRGGKSKRSSKRRSRRRG